MDEPTRKAWTRFHNGLKLDGKERQLIQRMVADMHEMIQRHEQTIWNHEHYYELSMRRIRYEILMGRDTMDDPAPSED